MPREIRYISFSPTEALEAFNLYQKRRIPGWTGSVIAFRLDQGATITATWTLVDRIKEAEQRMAVTAAELAAALLVYCINNRIPVPAKAEKALHMGRDGGLVLAYGLGLGPDSAAFLRDSAPPLFGAERAKGDAVRPMPTAANRDQVSRVGVAG